MYKGQLKDFKEVGEYQDTPNWTANAAFTTNGQNIHKINSTPAMIG